MEIGVIGGVAGRYLQCVAKSTPSDMIVGQWAEETLSFAPGVGFMQVKVYVPKTVEIPSEYLLAIAKRATDSVGENAATVSATRGNLIRQAVHDGLIRDLDSLVGEDGVVDVVCDPGAELPLEVNGEPFSLTQLVDVLARRTSYSNAEQTARAA